MIRQSLFPNRNGSRNLIVQHGLSRLEMFERCVLVRSDVVHECFLMLLAQSRPEPVTLLDFKLIRLVKRSFAVVSILYPLPSAEM